MKTRTLQLALFCLATVILALLAPGCLGSNPPVHVVGYQGSSATGGAAARTSGGAPAAEARASYAPESEARDSAAEARPEPGQDADSRPGLGTVFGETRTSQVKHTAFERATSRPFSTLAIHYNDLNGLKAQTAYRRDGGLQAVSALAPAGGIAVSLLDSYGQVMQGLTAGGRTYVAGMAGDRYSLRVTNPTPMRIEVVASVDGLDVIDGKPASTEKRGYILDGGESLVIDGFRISLDNVAAFRFGKVEESYAARTSGDRNVGVIGVALFEEQGQRYTWQEVQRRQSANPFPSDDGFAQPPPSR